MQTINDALELFYHTQFISAETLFQQLFQLRIALLIQQFKIDTINQFWQTLQLIRLTTNVNALATPANAWNSANFAMYLYYTGSLINVRPTATIKRTGNQSCSCVMDLKCHHWIDYRQRGYIMPIGCYLLETFLLSNLSCFFNSSCIEIVIGTAEGVDKPSPLNLSLSSLFFPNTTLEMIMKHLMIEQWHDSSNYSNYFEQCNPIQCTYTYSERYNVLYMMSMLISLFGGLILKLTRRQTVDAIPTPYIDSNEQKPTVVTRLRLNLVNWFLKLNLFEGEDRSNEQNERWITRCYLFLFSLTSLILIIYTFVIEQTMIVTVSKPTLKQYEYLLEQHKQLYCPCTRISIQYTEFTQINSSYHEVCSSDFTSTQWIQYLIGDRNYSNPYLFSGLHFDSDNHQMSNYDQLDFRTLSISQFYFLSQLCQLSQEIVQDAITEFQQQTFINSQAMSRLSLKTELHSIVEKFRLQIPLKMLREIELITVNQTGTGLSISTYLFAIPRHFDNCNCGTSSNCSKLSTIYNKNGTILLTIPGFYVGCLSSQALIQSTLECFYNRTCLDQIQSYIDYNQFSLNVTPLNISKLSRYSPKTSIEEMLKDLFIEEWNSLTDYDQYYKQCQPSYCQYQYVEQYSVSSITKLTGLVSGLNLGFRLITPVLVKIFLFTSEIDDANL
ncbi:unnamed protein product [Rotaria sordida]|uniref:Uncharacterized protein n=1 Tax=Rotaria sordida TaxID=392033 RepID=A0A818MPM2_9BILA|nr:unnamed protein product [Rotaria sordida]